jgi:hypothetical protein
VYSLRGRVLRNGNLDVMMVVVVLTFTAALVVVVGVMGVMTDVARKLTTVTFTDGLSSDRCDGSSSKNECNGEFDLNHC